MSLQDKSAGIECDSCGHEEIVYSEIEAKELASRLKWVSGNPICPECGEAVTFEHYLD